MSFKFVFWDWNGTILNDASAACDAVNVMLEKRGRKTITLDEYRSMVDVPIVRFYEKVLDMSKESMKSLSDEFNPLCHKFTPENPVSIETIELIKTLNQNGIKQYIFSSSHNKFIEPYLERFGISQYFETVLGAKDCNVGSKVERTLDYIEKNNINKDEILFVGDMVHDSEVATAVGSECVLVSSGHQCEKALLKTGRRVISSLSELIDIINSKRVVL
ncbi:MAG: HAD family hydrolase [Clostridia bacterium]|nr:HAD family hydrolase [Clostridia bacterium]